MLSAPGRPHGSARGAARTSVAARRGSQPKARSEATDRAAVRQSGDGRDRERASVALGRCPERQRLVLALLLVERLSPAEAASALSVSVRDLKCAYRETLANLRRATLGMSVRAGERARPRRARGADDRLRKAS